MAARQLEVQGLRLKVVEGIDCGSQASQGNEDLRVRDWPNRVSWPLQNRLQRPSLGNRENEVEVAPVKV